MTDNEVKGISGTATPHPALSRKGRGKGNGKKENGNLNTPSALPTPLFSKRGITTQQQQKGKWH
jgi:hypothetical protein